MSGIKANAKWILLGAAIGYFAVPYVVSMVKNR